MICTSIYYIMWSSSGLETVFNFTKHDKQYILDILGEENDAGRVGNPMRGMIVNAVSNGRQCIELWEIESPLSEEEIIAEFENSAQELKQEIRKYGNLIFAR